MTTIEMTEVCPRRPAIRLVVTIPGFVWAFLRRYQQRRRFARLSRLPPRLICDAGFDPEEVYDAVPGRWEEMHPGRLRIR